MQLRMRLFWDSKKLRHHLGGFIRMTWASRVVAQVRWARTYQPTEALQIVQQSSAKTTQGSYVEGLPLPAADSSLNP